MNREETFNTICTVLEEYDGDTMERVAEQLIAVMSILSDDILDHLDPPVGLKHWLVSHGLSLVVTHSPTPPQVWGILQGEDEEDDEEADVDLEGEPGESFPLQVGGYVEYRTAPAGPRQVSNVGSGRINAITSEGWVIVQDGPTHETWVNPQTDLIRPSVAPGQIAEVLP